MILEPSSAPRRAWRDDLLGVLDQVDQAEQFKHQALAPPDPAPIDEWAAEHFFIPETKRPIVLEPVQRAVLKCFFQRREDGQFFYDTGVWSSVKKTGKTTIAGCVMQWAAEQWGDFGEIYHMGNKFSQAKERAFRAVSRSIKLSPYASNWDRQETRLTYQNESVIKPLPINPEGEAGGNQRLTAWTEVWGYKHDAPLLMWDEMQNVPTQHLRFRFVESYAGFLDESLLLWSLWERGHPDHNPRVIRLHDEYPIYGLPDERFIAYIDTGVEARRMSWQTPEYYATQKASERPKNFARIHMNEWVTSENNFVDIALWNGLVKDIPKQDGKKLNVVIGVDASESKDCTAASVVALHDGIPYEIETFVAYPPKGGTIDYEQTIDVWLKSVISRHRVVCIAYDNYQLHHFMQQRQKRSKHPEYAGISFEKFGQDAPRVLADTGLEGAIRLGTMHHSGNDELRKHIQNANSKAAGADGKALRLVKRTASKPIDAAVALSMARYTAIEKLSTEGFFFI